MEGQIQIIPVGASTGWSYSVDMDQNGAADRSGILERGLGFFYVFQEVGVHQIAVTLERGSERHELERFVVVNDQDATLVVAQRQLTRDPLSSNFEGIAVDHAGTTVFASDFSASLLFTLDAVDLEQRGPPVSVTRGPEGMAVSPSDSFLFIIHKRGPLTKFELPALDVRSESPVRGFFVHALDDRRVVVSGEEPDVRLIDTEAVSVISSGPGTWHFAVSSDLTEMAVLDFVPSSIRILGLPGLTEKIRIMLPDGFFPDAVAFRPDGQRLYVLGPNREFAEPQQRFQVYDPDSGALLRDMIVESSGCFFLNCAANVVAISASGRFVAFEQTAAILIVDTTLDLPVYRSNVGGSVAASRTEEAFYALSLDGIVSKIVIQP